FRDSFIGSAKSRLGWLTSLFRDLPRQLSIPVLATSLSLIAALGIGYYLAGRFVIPINNLKVDSLQDGVVQGLEALPIYSVGGVFTVWLHNLRALMLATLLGIFSFGALGLLVIMLPLVIIGYFMAALTGIGITPLMFLGAFVLPHGIVEIPAMIIAGAAILRLGATLAAPAPGKTIGAAFLDALASWTKVFFIVVAPMLLLAAVLEVYLTPTIVARFFGG
ncbi:MAG: stage II sporulation protein M, partial [Anaerolineales bacterium]